MCTSCFTVTKSIRVFCYGRLVFGSHLIWFSSQSNIKINPTRANNILWGTCVGARPRNSVCCFVVVLLRILTFDIMPLIFLHTLPACLLAESEQKMWDCLCFDAQAFGSMNEFGNLLHLSKTNVGRCDLSLAEFGW